MPLTAKNLAKASLTVLIGSNDGWRVGWAIVTGSAAGHDSLAVVDPADALAQLMELSTEVVEVVLFDSSLAVEAHAGCSSERAAELARAGAELLSLVGSASGVTRIGVERRSGGLHVVVESGRTAVATTVPDAVAGLVTHDLRTALRRSAAQPVDA